MMGFNLVVLILIVIIMAIHPLLYEQGLGAMQELKVQVWLADVNSNTGKVQVCVDIPETGASSCKEFDASSNRKDSVGLSSDPIIIDAGIYKLNPKDVEANSTLLGCVYVFEDETGSCGEQSILPTNGTHEMMLYTKVKPVFYDKETERLYKKGQCYQEDTNSKFCLEDEGVQYPEPRK